MVTGGLHPSGRQQVIPALLSLVERLARAHDVHAFALRHLPAATTYRLLGATVHDLGRPAGGGRQWRALNRAIRRHGPFDIIHGYWADPAGLLAAVIGKRLGIASVVTCDSGEFTSIPDIGYGLQRSLRGRAIVALACRLASSVHVTSRFMEGLAAERQIQATCIPLGVEVRRDATSERPAEGPPWRLLQTAALNRVKDHSTLLDALARLRKTVDVELDLVGEDTMDGRLQHEAMRLGVQDVVRFHGFVPHDQLAAFRRAAHLYVQSSRHEAAGVAVLEAAAARLPIVGTRVGFVADWADAAVLPVSPGDPEGLAAAIASLLRDPARRGALAAAAYEWVTTHDADGTARRLQALYASLA